MSKEFPFLRFYPDEWLQGEITLQSDTAQALFVKIFCWYWKKDCNFSLEELNKRLINNKAKLKQGLNDLIQSNIIKLDDNQFISINFCNEQYQQLSEIKKKLSDAGRKGGKASVKPRLSYKDKDKDKDKDSKLYFSIPKDHKLYSDKVNSIFNTYIGIRMVKGLPCTNDMYFVLLNTLSDLAKTEKEAISIINYSCLGNYPTFYPLKEDEKQEKKNTW